MKCNGLILFTVLALATIYTTKSFAQVVVPQVGADVSDERKYAQKMLQRLSGILVSIDHPMLIQMEGFLKSGDRVGAAKVATGDKTLSLPGHPEFLNVVVKQMGILMSNREESIANASLNDLSASLIGITRDETDAREMLYGDFYYMGDATKAATGVITKTALSADLLRSNNHYQELDDKRVDIGAVLIRVEGQKIATDSGTTTVANPDSAGVITSRAFMGSHAIAGTNRRMVEYSFREFACTPMAEMADTTAIRTRIGRDIDRNPGGDPVKFDTTCAGCHSVMDGFRGAFVNFNFNPDSGSIKHTKVNLGNTNSTATAPFEYQVVADGDTTNGGRDRVMATRVMRKMNHNETNFPNGFVLTDNSFVNNAVNTKNASLFGWRGEKQMGGNGPRDFGRMLSDSKRFSQCMAKRVYESVCNPGGGYDYTKVKPMLDEYANTFEVSGYKFKTLFQQIVTNQQCIK